MRYKLSKVYWKYMQIPNGPLALFPRIMKIGSQIKGQETKQKIEATHNGQLPKKLILTRKLTLLSERNAVF
jgi:hypothetical protein